MKNENFVKWNSDQKILKSILGKKDKFEEGIALCLKQHAMVHSSKVAGLTETTFEDELWENMDEYIFRMFVKSDHGKHMARRQNRGYYNEPAGSG